MSIATSIGAALVLGAAIFLLVWAGIYRVLRRWEYVTFTPRKMRRDPSNKDKLVVLDDIVDFDPRHGHYMKTAEVITTLASASLVFIPTMHFRVYPPWFAFSLVLLGLSVASCVGFMAFLTYFYENFLWMPTTYTAAKSALLHSLGFTGLACFAIAYVSLAVQIARSLLSGAVSAIK